MIEDFKGVQHDILTSKNCNILVSAGAGSGKTTVMIEKIADLIINQNVPVNSLLVVTFTVLAAEEMKERLIEKLHSILQTSNNKESILNKIEQVKIASIDTIDGFASKTIKKYFYALQINPNIEIISDATKDYYLMQAMKKTIDNYQQTEDRLAQLLDIFGGDGRNLNVLSKLILETYYNIINIEDYNKFLNDAILEYQHMGKCADVVKQKVLNVISFAKKQIIDNFSTLNDNFHQAVLDFVTVLKEFKNQDSLICILEKLQQLSYPELKGKNACEEIKFAVKKVKEYAKKLKAEGLDELDKKNAEICIYLSNFVDFLKEFMQNYSSIKQKNNLIDFNDLNRLMLKLLENNKVKTEMQNQFTHIFVDEYQDVNPLQDKLISELVNNSTHLFLVGDVKQSIYGFRGANPNSFLNRYTNYANNNDVGKAFNMNTNYRSNPKILKFVNDVFSRIMTKNNADIDYYNDCLIDPQREDIVDDKVNILLVPNLEKEIETGLYSVKNAKSSEDDYSEACLVLLAITQLINKPFYDAKLKQMRTLEYSDIAVLARSSEDEATKNLIEYLKNNNVPIKSTSKLDIAQNEGVKLVISILKCVVGVADDVDYLSSFVALTTASMEEVVTLKDKDKSFYESIKQNGNSKVASYFNTIEEIYNFALHSTNSELIHFILNNCGVKYYFIKKKKGHQVLNDIEEFVSKLSALENTLNLAEFIKVVESSKNNSSDVENLDEENSVTVQTIHKSKGLEYPVVILFNTSKQFNYITDNALINFNAELGLGVDYYNYETRTKTNSVVRYAIKQTNDVKCYKEEMRLLYVALTRAKNKLIITGTYNQNVLDGHCATGNFLSMLLNGCGKLNYGKNDFANCDVFVLDKIETPNEKVLSESRKVLKPINFNYKNSEKFDVPLKNTVTALNNKNVKKEFILNEVFKRNAQYDAEEDRALIGIHYHKALESLDFSSAYKQNTNFEDVDYKKIEQAYNILSKLAQNAHMHKEAEFMMYVPYNSIMESEITDKVLVQGVVDLIIEYETSITIVDYKFSLKSIKELKNNYKQQLNLYKQAVENAFNKPVNNIYIYSINSGEIG